MGQIARQLRSLSGAMLGITILLIATFFVLNFIATRAPAPVSTAAGWAFNRATGDAYGPAAPAMTVSPYSANSNLGPLL